MANSLSGGITTLIANDTIEYLRTRSACLGRIHVENRQEANVAEGGNTVNILKPAAAFTPTAVSYSADPTPQDITIPSVALTFGNHFEQNVSVNMLESRQFAGNFARILTLIQPGMLEGLVTKIDKSVTALYSGLTNTAVGTAGSNTITDADFRSALGTLAGVNVAPEFGDVHFVMNHTTYWATVGNSQYQPAYAVGTDRVISTGNLKTLYDVNVGYSPNIVTTATSPVTTENMVFHKDAFVIGFVEFEPASKYGAQVVEEAIVTDPMSGVSLRVMKYYSAGKKTWFYNIDVKWGVSVLDGTRGIVIKS